MQESNPVKQTVSEKVLERLGGLVELSNSLVEKARNIEPVCKPNPPTKPEGIERTPKDEWPTLFSEMRDQIDNIRANINDAIRILDRSEI